jgi:serine/threonine-protein kinase
MLQPGQVVGTKYRIVRLIGEGGMGSVYEAQHEVLGHRVALKFLHPEIASQPSLEQRFLQEARLSATINNPHIVRVTDVDTSPDGAYLVMDLLQGEPLQELIDREERLGTERAIAFALQILDGLNAAHALGVVHRDLKPDNVFVTPGANGPLLKLLDFGIAKIRATEEYQMTLTRPGAVMGTPEYMAPEQAYSADLVDQRSDIYAVGVMLFEMLSGQRPADGETPQEIAEKAIKGQVRKLDQLCPHLPKPLIAVVQRAIEPQPDDRWGSALELKRALLPFAVGGAASPNVDSRAATGMATPFVAVHKTPRIERMGSAPEISVSFDTDAARMSTVPKTVPPEEGPPLATQQQPKAKTASMPEVALQQVSMPVSTATVNLPPQPVGAHAPPGVPAPPAAYQNARRRKKSSVWIWLTVVLLATAGTIGGWYYFVVYLDDPLPPPPPLPVARSTTIDEPEGPELVEPVDDPSSFDEEDEEPTKPRRTSPSPTPRKRDPAPPPTLPTFQIPTNLPIPTEIPTTLPSFPLPAPKPTESPRGAAPAPESPQTGDTR